MTTRQALPVFLLFLVSPVLMTARESREVKKTVPMKNDGRVFVDTYKGGITVTTWDQPQVEIVARIEPGDSFFDRDDDAVQETEIRISGEGDEVRIRTDYSRIRSHHSSFFGLGDDGIEPSVYYSIRMPKSARLSVKDYKSKTSLSGLQSDVAIDTYKGDVEVSDLAGSLDLKTYKGDSRISFSRLARDSRFETSKGSIEISVPKKTGFVVDYRLGRKAGLHSDFDLASISSGRHRRDEIHDAETVNGGGPRIVLSSEKGVFSLREE